MSTEHTDEARGTGLPVITRRDIDRFVLEGRCLRAREIDRLLRSAGRGLARLARALGRPLAPAIRGPGSTARMGGASPAEPVLR